MGLEVVFDRLGSLDEVVDHGPFLVANRFIENPVHRKVIRRPETVFLCNGPVIRIFGIEIDFESGNSLRVEHLGATERVVRIRVGVGPGGKVVKLPRSDRVVRNLHGLPLLPSIVAFLRKNRTRRRFKCLKTPFVSWTVEHCEMITKG